MPRRTLVLPGLLALAVATAACGGGSTPSPSNGAGPSASAAAEPSGEPSAPASGGVSGDLAPGTTLDACGIVTPDDIAAATGTTAAVEPGTLEQKPTTLSPGKTECTYEGAFGRILVELTPEDGANLYDAARGAYDDAVDLAGIGDGAFNSDGNHRAFVWQDRVTVMLTMFLSGDLEQAAVATALGQSLVSKL